MTKSACPEYDNAGELRIIVVQLLHPLIHSGTTAWCTPCCHACLATVLSYLRSLNSPKHGRVDCSARVLVRLQEASAAHDGMLPGNLLTSSRLLTWLAAQVSFLQRFPIVQDFSRN